MGRRTCHVCPHAFMSLGRRLLVLQRVVKTWNVFGLVSRCDCRWRSGAIARQTVSGLAHLDPPIRTGVILIDPTSTWTLYQIHAGRAGGASMRAARKRYTTRQTDLSWRPSASSRLRREVPGKGVAWRQKASQVIICRVILHQVFRTVPWVLKRPICTARRRLMENGW